MVFVDTSFLISLYGQDVKTPEAIQMASSRSIPIQVHAFNEYEFANALRLLVFRQKITTVTRQAQWQAYEADKQSGKMVFLPSDKDGILARAELLSCSHTESAGQRAYDILHVAAALELGASEFWSFDGKQRALAAAEGLRVGP